MSKTEVILTHNIVGLGAESDQVKVAAGYARNYLIPRGFAIPVTATNKRRLEALKQRRAEREAHELNTMTELARSLEKLICIIKIKTGDDGKMFGAVTPGAIADQLKQQFDITLDKRKIHIEKPIRALGQHVVEMRLHADVATTLKVLVESTTPAIPPAEAPPAETTRREGPRTDRRTRRVIKSEPPHAEKGSRTDKAEKPTVEKAGRAPKAEKPAKPHKPEQSG